MQYITGTARQQLAQTNYVLRDGDIDSQWNSSYNTTLINIFKLMDMSKGTHAYYYGISEVLMANSLGIMTDVWGDMPYSEACKGKENLSPRFDTQEQIYNEIFRLLDDAVVNLSIPGVEPAVSGDFIYGGDLASWIKAAHALKARYILHLSKRNPATAYADALLALPDAFTSNNEDCQFNFGSGQTESNPFWQFMDQRADVVMHKTFVDMLDTISKKNLSMADPRLPVFASLSSDPLHTYKGAGWGDPGDDASIPGGYYEGSYPAAPQSPVYFITNTECLFIKAECQLQTGIDLTTVKNTLVEALTSSLDKFGVSNQEYVDSYSNYISQMGKDSLYKQILIQKYIALYYQSETFVDWRRTNNLMGLQANPMQTAGTEAIPRRFPYGNNEKTYNAANVPNIADIWVPLWWDVMP
jgi:hypothetical protein